MSATKSIQLKRQASELRNTAHAKLDELKDQVQRQHGGELDDGETRLSAEEIQERQGEIEDLVSQAKGLEGLDSLDGLMNRPEGEMTHGAQEVRNDINGPTEKGEEEKQPLFKSVGAFLRTLRTLSGGYEDPVAISDDQRKTLRSLKRGATRYLQGEPFAKELGDMEVKTLVGDNAAGDTGGEFLVPTEHMAELLRAMGEQQQFANRARRVPMTRRTIDFPRLGQTDANDTRPIFSFAAVQKIAEGAQKPEREPSFEQLTLTAIKYAAYLEAGDELLTDSIVDVPPVLVDLLTSAIAYEFDRDTMRGQGSGEPLGFIGSAAEFNVPRDTADQVSIEDIFEMEARFFGTDGIYMYHPSVIPQLYAFSQSNIIVWNADLSTAVPGTLLGRALVRTHKLPTLGTKGDINLVDPSFYLVGDLQQVTVANSTHFKFRNDVTAWRATFRAAGTPWPNGTFSHEASGGSKTYEVSPFVVLDLQTAS